MIFFQEGFPPRGETIAFKGCKTIPGNIGEINFLVNQGIIDPVGSSSGLTCLPESFLLDKAVNQGRFADITTSNESENRFIEEEFLLLRGRLHKSDFGKTEFQGLILFLLGFGFLFLRSRFLENLVLPLTDVL